MASGLHRCKEIKEIKLDVHSFHVSPSRSEKITVKSE
jgi:hypothetical protein